MEQNLPVLADKLKEDFTGIAQSHNIPWIATTR